jgi:c-di-GMP-related signal transduction protein
MRLVNSVAMGLKAPIQSLSHAVVVLGARQLQRWLQVLLFAHHGAGDSPSPLLTLAVTRGKLMELLAARETGDEGYRDRAFMTGILSLMDTLLGTPLPEVVAQLNLTDDVRDALLSRAGSLGALLDLVEALERNDHDTVRRCLAGGRPCALGDLPAIQVAAMAWRRQRARRRRWVGLPSAGASEPEPVASAWARSPPSWRSPRSPAD